VFGRPDWADAASEQLKEFNLVQLYSDIVDLGRDDRLDNCQNIPPSAHGFIGLISDNKLGKSEFMPTARQNKRGLPQSGMAWAIRRQILERHGLYDAMIVGGGARAHGRALFANFDKHIEATHLTLARREHYLKWAVPYHHSIDERVGYVPGRLYHLWHGEIDNRNYDGRHRTLAEHDFDPNADIAVGSNGAWQWARSRPDLEKFLTSFFIGRAEDG
jgi:hypothetical protein